MKITSGIIIFGSSIFIPTVILSILNILNFRMISVSPNSHLFFEAIPLFIGLLFSYYALQGFRITGSFRLALVGIGLIAGGIMYFSHALSVPGSKFGFASESLTAWQLGLGTIIVSLFLFLASAFDERLIAKNRRAIFIMMGTLIIFILVAVSLYAADKAVTHHIIVGITTARWTPLGRLLLLFSTVLLAVAAIRYLHGAFQIQSALSLFFATGVALILISEITFGMGVYSYDAFYWLSHVWRSLGYISFFYGLMLARREIIN